MFPATGYWQVAGVPMVQSFFSGRVVAPERGKRMSEPVNFAPRQHGKAGKKMQIGNVLQQMFQHIGAGIALSQQFEAIGRVEGAVQTDHANCLAAKGFSGKGGRQKEKPAGVAGF